MKITRRTFTPLLVLAAAYAVWALVRPGAFEVVVMRTFTPESDAFTSLWVIDDEANDFVWIRAHRPDRRWLAHIEQRPEIELRRGHRSARYVARVFDDAAARGYVHAGFRAKYGLADWFREMTQGDDTIPVRLRVRSR